MKRGREKTWECIIINNNNRYIWRRRIEKERNESTAQAGSEKPWAIKRNLCKNLAVNGKKQKIYKKKKRSKVRSRKAACQKQFLFPPVFNLVPVPQKKKKKRFTFRKKLIMQDHLEPKPTTGFSLHFSSNDKEFFTCFPPSKDILFPSCFFFCFCWCGGGAISIMWVFFSSLAFLLYTTWRKDNRNVIEIGLHFKIEWGYA